MILKRPIRRWHECSPSAMATQSQAAIQFAFEDAKHDILYLSQLLREVVSMEESFPMLKREILKELDSL